LGVGEVRSTEHRRKERDKFVGREMKSASRGRQRARKEGTEIQRQRTEETQGVKQNGTEQ
jgi:hypothetical protein